MVNTWQNAANGPRVTFGANGHLRELAKISQIQGLRVLRLGHCLPRLAPHLPPETRVADLALDSMDTVELLCVVHAEFGVRLTESEFHPEQTIGGLLTAISQRTTTS